MRPSAHIAPATRRTVKISERILRRDSIQASKATGASSSHRTATCPEPLASSQPVLSKKSTFLPMSAANLAELSNLWANDQRVPKMTSRKAWSTARNLDLNRVNNWWYRKRTLARKAGIKLPEGTYELPVGSPLLDGCGEDGEDATMKMELEIKTEILADNLAICSRSSSPFSALTPQSDFVSLLTSSATAPSSPHSRSRSKTPQKGAYMRASVATDSTYPLESCFSDTETAIDMEAHDKSRSSPAVEKSGQQLTKGSNAPEGPQVLPDNAQTESNIASDLTDKICNQGLNALSKFTCSLCKSETTSNEFLESSGAPDDSYPAAYLHGSAEVDLLQSWSQPSLPDFAMPNVNGISSSPCDPVLQSYYWELSAIPYLVQVESDVCCTDARASPPEKHDNFQFIDPFSFDETWLSHGGPLYRDPLYQPYTRVFMNDIASDLLCPQKDSPRTDVMRSLETSESERKP